MFGGGCRGEYRVETCRSRKMSVSMYEIQKYMATGCLYPELGCLGTRPPGYQGPEVAGRPAPRRPRCDCGRAAVDTNKSGLQSFRGNQFRGPLNWLPRSPRRPDLCLRQQSHPGRRGAGRPATSGPEVPRAERRREVPVMREIDMFPLHRSWKL
jgi:hypothetical protein